MIGLHVGFTGTRYGMRLAQSRALAQLAETDPVLTRRPWVLHHGDCVGADAQVHVDSAPWRAGAAHGGENVVRHPGYGEDGPEGAQTLRLRADMEAAETRPAKPHLERNRDIVDETEVVVAAPYEMDEQPRGGTWSTIRYARERGRPLAIVYPNGHVNLERWPA